MIASEVREMLSFIDGNPTAYHTTAAVRDILLKAGFAELLESRKWALEPGKDYFVCRNGSSIIAFRMGDQLENYSFNVAAAHTDSPCFRIKENAEIHMGQNYTKLNTEGYGGMICATWMDRPLSVAVQCHQTGYDSAVLLHHRFPSGGTGPRPADDPQRSHPHEPRGQR